MDRSKLATLLDSAKSDDGDEGSANTGADEGPVDSNDGGEEPAAGVSQESAQEAESGGVNQLFTVTSSGDNSNQSVGVQGTANTGNAQNQVPIEQVDSSAENVEVEGSSSIEVSPEQDTQSQQEVDQAAVAAE